MAVYTTISRTDAQELFKSLGEIVKLEGIKEGVENTNYLVHLNDSKKYILTLFEKRTKETDLPYFNNLMGLFNKDGVNCPLSISIKNENIFKVKEKPCCIYTFVEGRPISSSNKEQLNSLGKSIAHLHQSGTSSSLYRKNMMLLPSWKHITESFSKSDPKISSEEYKYIFEKINDLQDKFPLNLRQINIHADLFKDNIFFLGSQVSGFIDFFFSCTDTVIYDLATFVNAWFFEENKFDEYSYINFLKSYQLNFELTIEEKDNFNFYLKVSAIRFFLTRLYDLHFNNEGNVKHKNPIEFFEIFKFHEANNIQDFF
jgi:homoserine kinase type II